MMLLCLMYVTDHYIQTKTQAHRSKSDLLKKIIQRLNVEIKILPVCVNSFCRMLSQHKLILHHKSELYKEINSKYLILQF